MAVFYCTTCWAEVERAAVTCPLCGDDIGERQRASDYVDKLVAALRHPEPTTPVRAAWILGELRERRAVSALIGVACRSRDEFLLEGAVEALGKIGDTRSLEAVREAARRGGCRTRRAAVEALRRLGDVSGENGNSRVKAR